MENILNLIEIKDTDFESLPTQEVLAFNGDEWHIGYFWQEDDELLIKYFDTVLTNPTHYILTSDLPKPQN